jgi:arylsulfatase A-like enzyme
MIFLLFACAQQKAGPPNILMVSMDTVRADHTSPYGYRRDTTPVLSALAATGTLYQNAFSNGNESAYSHGALFTGRYASELADPTYETYAIPVNATLISEALSAYGYQTAAFTAGGHVTADFGFNQGWDSFSAESSFASLWATSPKALSWIKTQVPTKKPWFAFVHGYDAHRPYTRPGPWDHLYSQGPGTHLAEVSAASPCLSEMLRGHVLYPELTPGWFQHPGGAPILATNSYEKLENPPEGTTKITLTDADVQHVVDHYDGALTYEDTLLGSFLSQLQDAGALENTVIIVLSDHGEDMLDHGYINHRTGLYNSCTKVPLIVSGPGFGSGKTEEGLVDGRDVAATILGLAGALPPAGSGGRDLRNLQKSPTEAVFAEGIMGMVTVRTATSRLIYQHAALSDPEYVSKLQASPLTSPQFLLYDETTDPNEQHNLLEHPTPEIQAQAESLKNLLVEWRRNLVLGTFLMPQENVSPEVAQQLREHGYWGMENRSVPASTPTSRPPQPVPDLACVDRLEFLPPEKRSP